MKNFIFTCSVFISLTNPLASENYVQDPKNVLNDSLRNVINCELNLYNKLNRGDDYHFMVGTVEQIDTFFNDLKGYERFGQRTLFYKSELTGVKLPSSLVSNIEQILKTIICNDSQIIVACLRARNSEFNIFGVHLNIDSFIGFLFSNFFIIFGGIIAVIIIMILLTDYLFPFKNNNDN